MIPSHSERASKKPFESGVANVTHPTDSIDTLQPTAKPTLIRRVTSKLTTIAIPARSSSQGLRSRPTLRSDTAPPVQAPRPHRATISIYPTLPNGFISREHREAALRERGLLPPINSPSEQEREVDQSLGPVPSRAAIPVSPTLPNAFISRQHREAALRERGLLPRKDLSEQEREADQRLGPAPLRVSLTLDGATEAERFKAAWLARNRASESSDSECGPPTPPPLQGTTSPSSPVSPEADMLHRSGDGGSGLPSVDRPSFCSSDTSMPPLSTSSYLEVLHEEPSE